MSRPTELRTIEVTRAMASLHPDWDLVNGKLHREFSFPSFAAAWEFMSEIAIHAEAKNHHPEWSNVYNRVTIDLVSHDVGAVTDRDLDLARTIDATIR